MLLVVTLPLWFYLVRHDLAGQSVRMLTLGIAWAISTLTLFVVIGARRRGPAAAADRRVGAVAGRRAAAGDEPRRRGAGAGYWALVAVDQDVRRPWAVGPMMLVTALVAAPFGSLVAALLPRELEGALGLLTVVAVQMLADPGGRWPSCCRSGRRGRSGRTRSTRSAPTTWGVGCCTPR